MCRMRRSGLTGLTDEEEGDNVLRRLGCSTAVRAGWTFRKMGESAVKIGWKINRLAAGRLEKS